MLGTRLFCKEDDVSILLVGGPGDQEHSLEVSPGSSTTSFDSVYMPKPPGETASLVSKYWSPINTQEDSRLPPLHAMLLIIA